VVGKDSWTIVVIAILPELVLYLPSMIVLMLLNCLGLRGQS